MSACGNQAHHFPTMISPYSRPLPTSPNQTAHVYQSYNNQPTYSSNSQIQFRSPLDLLSYVALNQQPLPEPYQSINPPNSSTHSIHYQQQQNFLNHQTYNTSNPSTPYHHIKTEQHKPIHDMSPVSSEDTLQICNTPRDVKENQQQHNIQRKLSHSLASSVVEILPSNNQSNTKILSDATKSRSQPSRFCHICSRTSSKVDQIACGNFATGACRKVVCQKCFEEYVYFIYLFINDVTFIFNLIITDLSICFFLSSYFFIRQNWDWEAAYNNKRNWICPHCRQVCPSRAQCAIYRRTNERRRELQQTQRQTRTCGRGGV